MRRFLTFLLPGLLVLCVSMQDAHAVTAVANNAMFRDSSNKAYLKLYFEVDPNSIHYRKSEDGMLSAKLRTEIRIQTDTGTLHRESYYLQTRPYKIGDQPSQIREQLRLPLPQSGRYKVELRLAEDAFPGGQYYADSGFTTAPPPPYYSSIELLDTFFAADAIPGLPPQLIQGGYANIPRPLAFYDEGQHRLLCYYELYHADSVDPAVYPLYQVTYLSKRPTQRIAAEVFLRDTVRKPASRQGFHVSLSLASLKSDNYYLNTSLQDAKGREYCSASMLLQLSNKNPVVDSASSGPVSLQDASAEKDPGKILNLGTTFVAKFDMARMRAILKMILPRAEPSDIPALQAFLEKPDDVYMRYFIYNYFRTINPEDPAKAWMAFANEIREVNKRFNANGRMGYETDRGITWMRYGEPVELVRVQNEAGSRPYEIWRYNQDEKIRNGGGVFLFYSPSAMGNDFQLLHSTVRGERYNPNWRALLYVNGSTMSTNSRAAQYIDK